MDPHLDRYCITRPQFQKHIDFLNKKFRFVSLGELISILKNKEPEKKPCAVLTFDDAFENVYLTAYPVLLEKKIPFVVAIPTGLIDTKRSLWGSEIDLIAMRSSHPEISFFSNDKDRTLRLSLRSREERLAAATQLRERALSSDNGDCYRFVTDLIKEYGEQDFYRLLEDYPHLRIMSSRQLREMVNNGMEPACHGFYHNRLDTDNEDIIRQEVFRSKAHLHERLRLADVKHFILPHGKFTDKTLSRIRQAGFSSCLTTKNRSVERPADLHRLPRVKGYGKMKDFVWGLTK
jgi:peptidoglycan/xylan/chitin deacetylase (PgdA/CDA1 family)